MRRALCAIAVLALACLLIRAGRVGMAGDYVDPIGKLTAQDEALYANSAIRMAHRGGWLTPKFMGRFALYKPPLLYWLSGLSARLLGISTLTLRLPIALLCALALGLVFLWAVELRGWKIGACAALLLAANHLWHVLGSMCMTDGLLAALYITGFYCLFYDPWLESKRAFWGFTVSAAAAILTKSIAGVLPLGVLALYWLVAPAKYKPAFARICAVAALALALAAPWFVYQMVVHSRWFWVEHVSIEILGFGSAMPPQTSAENHAVFYLMRMALTDPILTALSLAALPAFFAALRKRSAEATLLFCWLAIFGASVMIWQYRNIAYLLPLIPAMAILAAGYGPLASKRSAAWMLALVSVAFAAKAATPSAPWGIAFQRGTVIEVAPILSSYCEENRMSELMLVGADDQLYASTLPLSKLRYVIVGTSGPADRYGMNWRYLGIELTTVEFNDLARLMPTFEQRLHSWGLASTEPVGSLIVSESAVEIGSLIRSHPFSDFLIEDRYRAAVDAVGPESHQLVEAPPGHFLLRARTETWGDRSIHWPCRM